VPDAEENYFGELASALRAETPPEPPYFIRGDETRVRDGIAVYRNNIHSSLSRALGEKFPVIKALVGDEFFKQLARAYFHAHPPQSPLLARYGDKLPEFLERQDSVRSLPYLPDMARLEIARLAAYHAADATPLTPEEITAAAHGTLEALQLKLHPSLRLVSSQYAIGSIWRKHHKDAMPGKLNAARPETVIVIRRHLDVIVEVASPPVFELFGLLQAGARLGEAMDEVLSAHPEFDPQSFFEKLFSFEAAVAATTGAKSHENRL